MASIWRETFEASEFDNAWDTEQADAGCTSDGDSALPAPLAGHSSTKCYKTITINNTTGNDAWIYKTWAGDENKVAFSGYVYIDAESLADGTPLVGLMTLTDSADAVCCALYLYQNSGNLYFICQFYNNGSLVFSSVSAVVSLDTWYRIRIAYMPDGVADTFQFIVNDTLVQTTALTGSLRTPRNVFIGQMGNQGVTGCTVYWDACEWNDDVYGNPELLLTSAIVESASASDTQDGLIAGTSAIVEAASAADTQDGLIAGTSAIVESASAAEAQDGLIAGTSEIVESASASDTQDGLIAGTSEIVEAASAAEAQDGLIVSTITESASANETETGSMVATSGITEAASAVDVSDSTLRYVDIPPAMHEDLIDPYSGGAWLWLAEIAVPGYSTERIARNTADVRYGGNDFEKFNLQIGEQMFSGDGSIPRVTLKVFQDVNRKIEDIVNETEGALGAGIKLIKVCEKFLDTPISALEADYENLAAESDSEWVTFTLGIPNPLTQRIPLRIYSASMCPWATPSLFKGPECQYAGEDDSCTGTYEDCYQKGNAVHWGGELGLNPNVI